MMVKYSDLVICDSINIENIFISVMTEKEFTAEIQEQHLLRMVQI